MNHFATSGCWYYDRQLPAEIQVLADKKCSLLRHDPHHPSLHLNEVESYWSARAGLHYLALACDMTEGLMWLCFVR
jgi:hypothetical protein